MPKRVIEQDPFDSEVLNPFKTHAIESNFWEVSALKSHYSPRIRSLCDLFTRPVALIPSLDPSDSLQTTDTIKRARLAPGPWQSLID